MALAGCTSGEHRVTILGLDGNLPPVRLDPAINDDAAATTALHSVLPSGNGPTVECFMGCAKLRSVPSNVFENYRDATSFARAFKNTAISIPPGLFSGCSSATDFTGTFENVHPSNSTSIPANLFQPTAANTLGPSFRPRFILRGDDSQSARLRLRAGNRGLVFYERSL